MRHRTTTTGSIQRIRAIPKLAGRPKDGHKGTFGRVLVIGGSIGMAGAPALVGRAALRSGAGLVTIAIPAPIQPTVAGLCPCATTIALPALPDGRLNPSAAAGTFKKLGLVSNASDSAPDAIVVGPGLGTGTSTHGKNLFKLIDQFRHEGSAASVIDADALNLASLAPNRSADRWDRRPHPRTIITPHPGELARMHGTTTRAIQADREGFALKTAHMMAENTTGDDERPVVVLKGAGTIVTDGVRLYVNRTGNPGMATGGSGDVLGGVIGALAGQGMNVFEAAVLGVYVHGLAGDIAAEKLGQISLTATDIIEALPESFVRVHRSKRRPS